MMIVPSSSSSVTVSSPKEEEDDYYDNVDSHDTTLHVLSRDCGLQKPDNTV